MQAVTDFFARLSEATYVYCKNGSCYNPTVIIYLANTNNQTKVISCADCPPTEEMFERWRNGTGGFAEGVAKFERMMGGAGMEWAQPLLEMVFQHTTEYNVADEGSLNQVLFQYQMRRQCMGSYLQCQLGDNLMEERIHPYLALEHQISPPFVLAIQAGAQGPEQDVESASCFFEKLSSELVFSDEDERRRKSNNARTVWRYKTIKLYLGVHSMRKVSEDLNLWRTFTREHDSEDEDSSSDLHNESYASDSAEYRPDPWRGPLDLADAEECTMDESQLGDMGWMGGGL